MARSQIVEIQRARILVAAAELVEEVGYARMSVAQVIARARVSRKTFYDIFANREDCFTAIFEEITAGASARAISAYEAERDWLKSIRAALLSLLGFMDERPAQARLWIVDALGAENRVLQQRADTLATVAGVIDQGRALAREGSTAPDIMAEAIVGGIVEILHTRLLRRARAPLTELIGPLMHIIALPYLGQKRARSELHGPTAPVQPVRQPAKRRPKRTTDELKLRPTYRTVRALHAIREQPGASNRRIADACGVTDQGQMSKLLSRLARLGVVENRGLGQQQGGPNAWHLTERGAELVRTIHPRARGFA